MKKSYVVLAAVIALLVTWEGRGPEGQARAAEGVIGRYAVQTIEFNFVGKHEYKGKHLGKVLSFKRGDSVDAVQAEFGRQDVEQFYVKKGFAFVAVELDSSKLSEGKVTYRINEGARVKIAKVKFVGNKGLKSSELKKVIKSDGRRWLVLPKYYNEEVLFEDQEKVEDAYWRRGYLDRRVSVEKQFSAEKRKATISFVIDEGPAYAVEEVLIRGAEKIYAVEEGIDEQLLHSAVELRAGQIYRKQRAEGGRKRLLQLYRERGFVDARVSMRIERVLEGRAVSRRAEGAAGPVVKVIFEISEGQQFRIGRVDITGNKQTRDKVVRRVLDEYEFQPGRYYNADVAPPEGGGELERTLQRMLMAKEVAITPLAGADEGQKDVSVDVEEGQTGFVMLGAGAGSDSGFIGQLVFEQRNFDGTDWPGSFGEFLTGQAFKGAGQNLRIALQPGTEISEHVISFTEPYFQDKPVSFDLLGSSWERYRESYEEGRLKGFVGFSQRYEKRYEDLWRSSIGLRVENVSVKGVDYDAPKEIKDVKGSNELFGLKLGMGKDKADDRFNPGEGYRINTAYEQVAGERTFGLLSANWRWYDTLHRNLAEHRTILATQLHAATVLGDAPPFEKYYGGGMRSIRGFEYRGMSPRGRPEVDGVPVVGGEAKDPIGSDWIFMANAELIVPLTGEEFAGLFFLDSGTVETGPYRASVGAGIQIQIPHWFGPVPMRFGVAAPFQKDDSDDTEAFFFYVGRLF